MIWRDIDFWFTCMVVCLAMDIWMCCIRLTIWRDFFFWFTCMAVCLSMDIWMWCVACDVLDVSGCAYTCIELPYNVVVLVRFCGDHRPMIWYLCTYQYRSHVLFRFLYFLTLFMFDCFSFLITRFSHFSRSIAFLITRLLYNLADLHCFGVLDRLRSNIFRIYEWVISLFQLWIWNSRGWEP